MKGKRYTTETKIRILREESAVIKQSKMSAEIGRSVNKPTIAGSVSLG